MITTTALRQTITTTALQQMITTTACKTQRKSALNKLSLKLTTAVVILILTIEGILLLTSLQSREKQLRGYQIAEKQHYGVNKLFADRDIDDALIIYTRNIILLTILISAFVAAGFYLIYYKLVGRYVNILYRVNRSEEPLTARVKLENLPKDEIGNLIQSREDMLDRISIEGSRKQKLLRILSHDLANLLTVVIANLSRAKKLATPLGSEQLLEKIAKIEFAANEQKNLIDKVRTMDAVRSGVTPINLEDVSLEGIFLDSKAIFEERLANKSISLVIKNLQDGIVIKSDRVMLLNNVVNNLLSNAIKFSVEGKLIEVVISHSSNGDTVTTLTDSGIGMSQEMVEHLFDETYSKSRVGTDGEQGTGFGLLLAKESMKILNGSINIVSRSIDDHPNDHGTTFTLTFHPHQS
jgi:signal transduction histidine kinase